MQSLRCVDSSRSGTEFQHAPAACMPQPLLWRAQMVTMRGASAREGARVIRALAVGAGKMVGTTAPRAPLAARSKSRAARRVRALKKRGGAERRGERRSMLRARRARTPEMDAPIAAEALTRTPAALWRARTRAWTRCLRSGAKWRHIRRFRSRSWRWHKRCSVAPPPQTAPRQYLVVRTESGRAENLTGLR